MSRTIAFLTLPIGRNLLFYVGTVAMFSISILFVEYGGCSRMRAGLEMFGDVYLLCALMLLVPKKLRSGVKITVFCLLYLIGLADMLCYRIMGIALVPNIFQTWLQTNPLEATEALRVFLSPQLLLSPVLLLLLLPLAIILVRRRLPQPPFRLLAALLVLTLVSAVYGIGNKRYLYEVFARTSDDDMQQEIMADSKTREYLPVYRLALSFKEMGRFSTMREHLLANVRHTQVDSCSFRSPLIVLIIGESYNRHHSSLYGYGLCTTPFQEQLHREGNLFRFDDVIASYNLTFKSFQNMLTLYDYDAAGKWYDYPVVPALFRKAGYDVSFFSNQNTLDKASAFTDFSEDVFMNNPEISRFMFDRRNTCSHPYDMDLVDDYLTLADTTASTPQLVIFHFIGLHAEFRLRFPEGQQVFGIGDYPRSDLNDSEKQTLADYDNAVAYNDQVIRTIIGQFAHRDAVVIYVPDHGELVYDDCQELGRDFRLERQYVVPQYDIPFWIYCSDLYKERRPELCQQMADAVGRPFMTDDLPHLLLSLAGIACDGYCPERNLIDPQFNVLRRRMIRGEADYDLICR